MRALVTLVLAACGASPPPQPPMDPAIGRAISVEWKAEQGDGNLVLVTLVVDGRSIAIGTLDAATEMEAGTPATCALRAAHPLRTEFMCGAANYYAAELQGGELVITLVDGERNVETRRIAVTGEGLAVKPYALPISDP